MINIIQGHLKEFFKLEQDLYESRIKICNECPLQSSTIAGLVCDTQKCIKDGIIYKKKKSPLDSICGCGCRLSAKLRLKDEHCELEKW